MNSKRYYWLKLKDDFFTQKEIKKLRRIAGGDTFTIIYLKLQLLSLKNDGKLVFEGVEDDFVEEMSLVLDEEPENVRMTIMFLQKHGLIEELNNSEYLLPKACESIGSESTSAERVRKHREKGNLLQCNTVALQSNTVETKCNTEIREKREENRDKREDKKKSKYGEYAHVLLTHEEYLKLSAEYQNAEELIKFLDEYIEMKGYKAKSHYLCLKKWVADAVNERKGKKTAGEAKDNVFTEIGRDMGIW